MNVTYLILFSFVYLLLPLWVCVIGVSRLFFRISAADTWMINHYRTCAVILSNRWKIGEATLDKNADFH